MKWVAAMLALTLATGAVAQDRIETQRAGGAMLRLVVLVDLLYLIVLTGLMGAG